MTKSLAWSGSRFLKAFGSIILACLCGSGCERSPDPYVDAYGKAPASIQFLDQVESNSALDGDLSGLEFTTRDGQATPLKDIAAGKTLIVVMTRGYNGSICPYCSTQVSRLIANYAEIERRNAQVVVVYPLSGPGDAAKTEEFIERAVSLLSVKQSVPFPIVLDVELKAVDALGIRKDLSKSATYILDGEGRLQFAYVGSTLADRPSVQALLEQLDKIGKLGSRS